MHFKKFVQSAENRQFIKVVLYPLVLARRSSMAWRASIQDDILDNLCDLLDDDLVIKVSEFHGTFVVGGRSDLFRQIVKNKEYEPGLVQCCLKYLDRSRDVIDIGANIGFYTVLFGMELRDKKVLAIEPTPGALRRLYKNIQLNSVQDKTIVFEGVVSNHPGVAEIHTVDGKEEYSSLGVMEHPRISKDTLTTVQVSSTTIDQLVEDYSLDPGFIKIDVEGMEHVVFEGMQQVLSDIRPVILSELSDPLLRKNGSCAKEVIAMIKKYDYKVIDPLFNQMAPGKRQFGNILCSPQEHDIAD